MQRFEKYISSFKKRGDSNGLLMINMIRISLQYLKGMKKMKKTKKVICVISVLVILISCFSIFAFAESETYMGTHNGNSYVCTATCTSNNASAIFSYSGSSGSIRKIVARIGLRDNYGQESVLSFNTTSSTNPCAYNVSPPSSIHFISNRSSFYIGNSYVYTITVYPN